MFFFVTRCDTYDDNPALEIEERERERERGREREGRHHCDACQTTDHARPRNGSSEPKTDKDREKKMEQEREGNREKR